MIPVFPEFKKIEFSDKSDVENFTRIYSPYSDFNFMNLWSWSIGDVAELSLLNENLVIKFNDYITNEPFYTFIGSKKIIKTVGDLFAFCRERGMPEKLRFIAETVAAKFDLDAGYIILEDRDSFDYIYETKKLAELEGKDFREKRRQANIFKNNNIYEAKQVDVGDPLIRSHILNLFENWSSDKVEKIPSYFFHNEYKAILRFLDFGTEILGFGIYSADELIAVALLEKISDDYVINHFQKTLSTRFKYVNPFLMHEIAKFLSGAGITYINLEQDLGIPGLRQWKESYLPCRYLKKYVIESTHSRSVERNV